MWKSRLLAGSSILLMECLASHAGAATPPSRAALDVVRNLDVTSFPNSIGPRREPGKMRLRDYGFVKIEPRGRAVDVFEQPKRDWLFSVRVLHDFGPRKTICLIDQNVGGGTYHTVEPIEIKRGRDGLYRATKRRLDEPACPRYPADLE
jgi:hypothetical protein